MKSRTQKDWLALMKNLDLHWYQRKEHRNQHPSPQRRLVLSKCSYLVFRAVTRPWSIWKVCTPHTKDALEFLAFLNPKRLKQSQRQVLSGDHHQDTAQTDQNTLPVFEWLFLQDWETQQFHLIHRNKHRESGKIRRQRNIFWTKEQDKISEKDINKMEISN